MSMILRRIAIAVFIACTIAGCRDRDLSTTPQYGGLIGAQYRTKTALYANGVRRTNNSSELSVVTILPVQQTGPEIAFHRSIPIGHHVKVLAVHKRFMLFDDGTRFVVALDGIDLPAGVEVVIPLCCYYHSTDGFPDQSRFERVKSDARQ